MPQITKRNIAKATAAGFALGVFSCYLLAECNQRLEKTEVRPRKQKPEFFPESAIAEMPYGSKHKVGGFTLDYVNEGGDVSAVARYTVKGRDFRTKLVLREGLPATLSVPEKKIRLAVMLNGFDNKTANVSVKVVRAE
jgi:hypothetical protein